jgi:hypothetical protein
MPLVDSRAHVCVGQCGLVTVLVWHFVVPLPTGLIPCDGLVCAPLGCGARRVSGMGHEADVAYWPQVAVSAVRRNESTRLQAMTLLNAPQSWLCSPIRTLSPVG